MNPTLPDVLAVGGSPRPRGNSDRLLRAAAEAVSATGLSAETIFLRDYEFRPCVGCERCRKDKICTGLRDGMTLLYPKIVAARGLLLASPVHNYNVTAWMKAFIDRLYCFYDFTGDRPRNWSSRLAEQSRKAAIIAVAEQTERKDMGVTLEAMAVPAEALGYEVIGRQAVLGVFDRGKVRERPEAMREAAELGRRLVDALRT